MRAATAQQRRRPPHPLPWLDLMVTEPFYLLHLLAFFSYFAARASFARSLPPDLSNRLLRREVQAVLILLVYAAVKMVKEESWEGFVADTLFYAKGFLLAVSLIIDYNLSMCYLMAFSVIYVLTQQPPYDGLGDQLLSSGTDEAIYTPPPSTPPPLPSPPPPLPSSTPLVTVLVPPLPLHYIRRPASAHGHRSSSSSPEVEFRSLCSHSCVRASRFLPELSVIYSNKNISFGIVDIGHFPNAAAKYGISSGVGSSQLPTYILFDKGVEVARFPELNLASKGFAPAVTKNLLCRHFELDRHLIGYIHGK